MELGARRRQAGHAWGQGPSCPWLGRWGRVGVLGCCWRRGSSGARPSPLPFHAPQMRCLSSAVLLRALAQAARAGRTWGCPSWGCGEPRLPAPGRAQSHPPLLVGPQAGRSLHGSAVAATYSECLRGPWRWLWPAGEGRVPAAGPQVAGAPLSQPSSQVTRTRGQRLLLGAWEEGGCSLALCLLLKVGLDLERCRPGGPAVPLGGEPPTFPAGLPGRG